MSDAPGDDLWKHEWAGVLIRVQRKGEEEELTPMAEDRLEAVLARAAIVWSDPTRPVTPPFPDGSRSKSDSLPPPFRRTSSRRTGR